MSTHELTAKIRELKELKTMIDELEAEATAIEDTLKAHMTTQGVDELSVDIFKVKYKAVKSSRLDGKALKSELPDIAARYTVETEGMRFTVA